MAILRALLLASRGANYLKGRFHMRKQIASTAAKLLQRRKLVLTSVVLLFEVAEAISSRNPNKHKRAEVEGDAVTSGPQPD